jgi:hypothetical protein
MLGQQQIKQLKMLCLFDQSGLKCAKLLPRASQRLCLDPRSGRRQIGDFRDNLQVSRRQTRQTSHSPTQCIQSLIVGLQDTNLNKQCV